MILHRTVVISNLIFKKAISHFALQGVVNVLTTGILNLTSDFPTELFVDGKGSDVVPAAILINTFRYPTLLYHQLIV